MRRIANSSAIQQHRLSHQHEHWIRTTIQQKLSARKLITRGPQIPQRGESVLGKRAGSPAYISNIFSNILTGLHFPYITGHELVDWRLGLYSCGTIVVMLRGQHVILVTSGALPRTYAVLHSRGSYLSNMFINVEAFLVGYLMG